MGKRVLCLVLCMVLSMMVLAGCGTSTTSSDTAKQAEPAKNQVQKAEESAKPVEKKKIRVGFSNASVSNTWRVGMYEALKAEVAKYPEVELLYADANDNAAKQNSDVDDLLIKGIDLLLIAPATEDALNPAIEKVYDKGIPVIVFDRKASTDKYTSFVETSDSAIGQKSAERLVELLTKKYGSPKGNVVIIQGFMGSGPQIHRQEGIESVLSKYPDIKVVGNQAADFQRAKGMSVMENMLQANDKIDAVISHSGESLAGAIDAIDAAKRGDGMIYVGIDGYNGILKAIKAEKVDSTVLFPVRISADALQVGLKVVKGEKVDKNIQLPIIQVTKENVDKYLDPTADDGAWTY